MAENEENSPVGSGPQGEAVYQKLLEEIRSGKLFPGSRLREIELADRLGVSRTPVREAIRLLEGDGLITHLPRQGATVRRLDYAEVMELYEMRAVLEGTAARLAARTASPVEIEELERLNAALEAAETAAEAARLNRAFHATLLDAAKNRFLSRAMGGLERALMILGPTTLSDEDRARDARAEHQSILHALNNNEGEAAEAAMRAHIAASQRLRIRTLSERKRDGLID